jgi:energy-coupling factor transport system ATP-binding protein
MLRVATELESLARDKHVVFVITHDYEFILSACNRVLYLANGRMRKDFPMTDSNKATVLQLLREGGDPS